MHRRATLRHLWLHPWQLALAVLGITLGVAVIVGLDLSIASARRSFEWSNASISGAATHHVVAGPSRLPDSLFTRIRIGHGFRQSSPVVETVLRAETAPDRMRTLRLLGVDPFAEPPFRAYFGESSAGPGTLLARSGAVLLLDATAGALGLAPGDTFTVSSAGREQRLLLAGLLRPRDELSRRALADVAITDIASAQEIIGTDGLDRIDLIIEDTSRLALLRSLIPADAHVESAASRAGAAEQLTRAFDTNLRALSMLALVFGAFLIYNTMTFSVVQRRPLLGSLRLVGVTRGQIFSSLLTEAAALGAAGSVLGILLGVLLARILTGFVIQTVNDLYYVATISASGVDALTIIKGALAGTAGTVLAALAPAAEAARVAPHRALARSTLEGPLRRRAPAMALLGAVFALAGAILLVTATSLWLSFGALFVIILAAALLVPLATLLISRAIRPLAGLLFGTVGRMAASAVGNTLSRTAPAIAALAIAIAVGIAVGVMTFSFRGAVERWLGTTLQADVYISPPGTAANRSTATLLPAIIERMRDAPGVAGANLYRHAEVTSALGTIQITAVDLAVAEPDVFRFKERDGSDAFARFLRGAAVLVTEPFAYRHGLGAGDSIALHTAHGVRTFRIAGVFYDYSAERGMVFMQAELYRALWDDDAVNSMALYTQPDVDADDLIEGLRPLAAEQQLFIRSSGALRRGSLEVFDRTFAITGVMRILALLVAFVGVVSALMAVELERGREIGVLRALGLTPRQIMGLIGLQTAFAGLCAALFALPLGLLLAVAMINVVNRRSFGWTMPIDVDGAMLGEAALIAVGAALLAGVYPALRMARLAPAAALREE